jgi:uncharacterized protein (DUF2141 family)
MEREMKATHAALLAGLLAVAPAARAEDVAKGTLTVEVTTRSNKGVIRCAVWPDGKGFPGEVKTREDVLRVVAPSIEKHKATCTFADVPAGKIAVTVLHDLNDNNELDKNRIGIPKEPLGFSNGARIRFGPPAFDDATFAFAGKDTTIAITVN